MPRPLIGICAAVERAHWGPWRDEPAALVPFSYARAIEAAGGMPVLIPPDPASADAPDELLERIDGLILGGGTDIDATTHGAEAHPETRGTDPERDRFEVAMAHRAIEREMPVLGVCRGMQILNIANCGTLHQHLPEGLGHELHRPIPGRWTRHDVRLAPGSLAAKAAGSEHLTIRSHHHQGVDRVGNGFEATGWATDDDTIEAIESSDGAFVLGVLWHPEEDPHDQVIRAFVSRAAG